MARRRKPFVRLLRGLGLALAAWAAVTAGVVVALRWIDPPFTSFMVQSRVAALFSDRPGYDFDYQWRDWDQISPNAALAVVAAEDQKFPLHHGFDFKQIDKALQDRERGRHVRGASTISQQVAKNLFLWPGQSWFRKGLEAGITVLIELAWSKQRILEVYLNLAEFGRGSFGVQAASRRFFHKDASRLTRADAALLAAVLPAPNRFRVDAPSNYVRRRQAWIQRQMASLGGTSYVQGLE
ncbi:MAG: monofunctional biosynthetic peptidoglycan transglycosylase [Steroidobacteraceae bacterium]|nr:monofunctional biosynthetic peptidoglycan transglycosylase [Steroidobacteraceae bacterium]